MFISGAIELTTQLSKPVRILWLPKCRINKLGYLAREDYLDPLHLRVINTPVDQAAREAMDLLKTTILADSGVVC